MNTIVDIATPDPGLALDSRPDAPWVAFTLLLLVLATWGTAMPLAAQVATAGGAFTVSQTDDQCLINADVAVAPDGQFVVAWTNTDRDQLYARSYDADAVPITAAQVISGGDIDRPSVGIDQGGDWVIAYEFLLAGEQEASVARFDRHGTLLGSPFFPNALGENTQLPTVAVAAGGEYVVAWREGPDSFPEIRARRVASDGSFLGVDFAVAPGGPGRRGLDLAIEPDGDRFAATWDEGGAILARRFAGDGTPVAGEFLASLPGAYDDRDPSLTLSMAGELSVGWIRVATGVPEEVRRIRFTPKNGVLGQDLLGDAALRSSQLTTRLSNDAGTEFAVWTETDPAAPLQQRLSARVNAPPSTALPDASTRRSGAALDLDDRERGVLVWLDDPDEDGCALSLVGQRFQAYRTLEKDVTLAGEVHALTSKGAWKLYVYFPLGDGPVTVTLDGLPQSPPNDADLYMRYGDFPTLSEYDCRSFAGGNTAESCRLLAGGRPLLIGVNPFQAGAISFDLTVTEEAALFTDDFESGDTTAWSSASP